MRPYSSVAHRGLLLRRSAVRGYRKCNLSISSTGIRLCGYRLSGALGRALCTGNNSIRIGKYAVTRFCPFSKHHTATVNVIPPVLGLGIIGSVIAKCRSSRIM